MKTMTCKQLGGACDEAFSAETFDQIAILSKKHGAEKVRKGDEAHINAMKEMMKLMQDPDSMKEWMESRKAEFDGLPEE